MKIIRQGWSFEEPVDGEAILAKIERAGRTCYKSEDKITSESARKFVAGCIKSGHHSVIEHHNISVRIVTDRGVTHEIVRHRLAAYSQESTRYCNYSGDKFGNEITVILPVYFYNESSPRLLRDTQCRSQYLLWEEAMLQSQALYFNLLANGQTPQQARSVLPNSLKTEIVMTANIREWRHFFTLRADKKSHPQMVALAADMLTGFRDAVPVLFDDIHPEVK
jgi:thymidylate synthase (FAD)